MITNTITVEACRLDCAQRRSKAARFEGYVTLNT